jgi:hypothetical protein
LVTVARVKIPAVTLVDFKQMVDSVAVGVTTAANGVPVLVVTSSLLTSVVVLTVVTSTFKVVEGEWLHVLKEHVTGLLLLVLPSVVLTL